MRRHSEFRQSAAVSAVLLVFIAIASRKVYYEDAR